MQWAVLNDKYVNDMFDSSCSVNSQTNAEISLTLTRTSRQPSSDYKLNREGISPRVSSRVQKSIQSRVQQQQINSKECQRQQGMVGINPEKDFLALVDLQVQKFDQWMKDMKARSVGVNSVDVIVDNNGKRSGDRCDNRQGYSDNMKNPQAINASTKPQPHPHQPFTQRHQSILSMLSQLQHQSSPDSCPHCQSLSIQLQTLSHHVSLLSQQNSQLQQQLNRRSQESCRLQVSELMEELSYVVENRVLREKLEECEEKVQRVEYLLQEREEFLEEKEKEVIRLREEVERFGLERSTYQFKNKMLQTRLVQLEKSRSLLQVEKNSKSLLMSAAKNSTSYSQLSSNTFTKSTTIHAHPQTLLINTKQFTSQKQRPSPQDYIAWFDRIKVVFLQKYKKEEKQYMAKFHPQALSDQSKYKEVVNQFKKGHVRYEIARSCKNLADYIKKNKEGFGEILGGVVGDLIINSSGSGNEDRSGMMKRCQQVQQQLRKCLKISEGLQSQIGNLNRQLMTLKKSLLKQKQQKSTLLSSKCILQSQISELSKQLQLRSLQLQQVARSNQTMGKNQLKVTGQNNQFNRQIIVRLESQLNKKGEELKKLGVKLKKCERDREGLGLRVRELEVMVEEMHRQRVRLVREGLFGMGSNSNNNNSNCSNFNNYNGSSSNNNSSTNNNNSKSISIASSNSNSNKNPTPTTTTTTNNNITSTTLTTTNKHHHHNNAYYLTTCCNMLHNQEHTQPIIHQFQSRIYIQNHKLSYKFDLINHHSNGTNNNLIDNTPLNTYTNKLILNCVYNQENSLILSLQPKKHPNLLISDCIKQLYKVKQLQKSFIDLTMKMSVVGVDDHGVWDGIGEKHVNNRRDNNRGRQDKRGVGGMGLDNIKVHDLEDEQCTLEMLQGIMNYDYSSNNNSSSNNSMIMLYIIQLTTTPTSTTIILGNNSNNNNNTFNTNTTPTTSKLMLCSTPHPTLVSPSNQLTTLLQLLTSINLNPSSPTENYKNNRLVELVGECLDYQNSKNLIVVSLDQSEGNTRDMLELMERVAGLRLGSGAVAGWGRGITNGQGVVKQEIGMGKCNNNTISSNINSSSSNINQKNTTHHSNITTTPNLNIHSINPNDNSFISKPQYQQPQSFMTSNQPISPIPSIKEPISFIKQKSPISFIKQTPNSLMRQPITLMNQPLPSSNNKQPRSLRKQPVSCYLRQRSVTGESVQQYLPSYNPIPQPCYSIPNLKHNNSLTSVSHTDLSQHQRPSQKRISKHRNSSSDQVISNQGYQKKKRTISRLSIC